jgi:hypothetical protein
MPPQGLPNSTPMQLGSVYTFTFSQSAVPFVAATNNEILNAVKAAVPQLSNVSVSGESSFGGMIDLSFTYNDQDNNDLVGDMGQYIAQLVSTQFTLDGFTFIQGYGGPQGSQGSPTSDTQGIGSALDTLGKNALYVGIGIVLVVLAIKFI